MTATWAWAALLVALLGADARAEGERRMALIVRGVPPDPLAAEVLARVRGELRAARFAVDTPPAGDASPREIVETEARRPGVAAAMGIFFDAAEPEVWVADARSGRTTVELLMDPGSGERRASVLAAKAVDLLKAVLAEIPAGEPHERLAPPPAPPVAPPPVEVAPVPPEPANPHDRVLLPGANWLRAGDVQTFAPTVSFAWLAGRLGGRVLLAGLGTSTDKGNAAGDARVAQELGLIELLACWRPVSSLRACGAIGGGADLLFVRGTGTPGFEGSNWTLWSGVGAAGATMMWLPRRWFAIGADARAVGIWPSTTVRVDGASEVRAGGLGVSLTAGVGARL